MSEALIIDIGRDAVLTALLISAPALIIGMVVGLVISIFQATTQIQEQTLSFIPKILAIFFTLILCGPWMLRVLVDFTTELFSYLIQVSRW